MAELKGQPADLKPERVDTYRDWQAQQKIPVVRGFFVADVNTVDVEHWDLKGVSCSMVVLDGRPLGQTPLMGVQVSAGAHNVVFVNPERGRKSVHVDVDEGAKRTVSVRF